MIGASRRDEWLIDAANFPVGGDVADLLRFAVAYAILAPSSHNSQPWMFHVAGRSVEVYADRSRRLRVVDPDDRELVMSCAAALFNLQVTLRHFGADVEVTALPHGEENPLLARVDVIDRPAAADPERDRLFAAITDRHTTRTVFADTPVAGTLVAHMERVAHVERARLVVVPPGQHAAVTRLVTEADLAQMSDPRFRRELAHWLRANRPAGDDGMPGYAIGMSELESVVSPLVVRTFDMGGRQAAKDKDLSEGSALLAVLTTEGDRVGDWITAGQAMQRVLLTATAAQLRASFLDQPVEIPSLRGRLAQVLGLTGHPQLLLRFGYGTSAAPTPRRPVSDVLTARRPT